MREVTDLTVALLQALADVERDHDAEAEAALVQAIELCISERNLAEYEAEVVKLDHRAGVLTDAAATEQLYELEQRRIGLIDEQAEIELQRHLWRRRRVPMVEAGA